jgi:hypothetical protein
MGAVKCEVPNYIFYAFLSAQGQVSFQKKGRGANREVLYRLALSVLTDTRHGNTRIGDTRYVAALAALSMGADRIGRESNFGRSSPQHHFCRGGHSSITPNLPKTICGY